MSKFVGLWKRICKFLENKDVSDGYTKENTEGKDYAARRGEIFEIPSLKTQIESATEFCLRYKASGSK